LIDWISDTLSQGCTALQSPVNAQTICAVLARKNVLSMLAPA